MSSALPPEEGSNPHYKNTTLMSNNLSNIVRKINRFELKYMVSIQEAQQFKKDIQAYLVPDPNGDAGGYYNLSSLYYDSPGLRFYWEKIDGIRYRRKLRIRHYENSHPITPTTPVFVEIKQRLNRVTQKRRVVLPYDAALRLCTHRQAPDHHPKDAPVIDEILSMAWQYDLRPASVVRYARQAFIGTDYDIGLRVTFDKDLRYRANPLDLNVNDGDLRMFPAERVIIEIKANERVPYWLTELVAQNNLNLMRVSKYCRSIEMAERAPVPGWRLLPAY